MNLAQFAFNFFDPSLKATVGAGGRIVTANVATFPAVVGNGGAMGEKTVLHVRHPLTLLFFFPSQRSGSSNPAQ
jgi:hypothetical protein